MKLSDRLQLIADQIDRGETMADIGTDHGFLPIYLYNAGICPHVILSDISQGSLDKALADCEEYMEGEQFDLRIGDGVQVLSEGEVDNVVIAGMGGLLMADILADDLALSHSFKKLILQPRNNTGKLMEWLLAHDFHVERAMLVRERARVCDIYVIRPGASERNLPGYGQAPWLYDYPEMLKEADAELRRDYFNEEIRKLKRNQAAMEKGKNPDPSRIDIIRNTINYLNDMI